MHGTRSHIVKITCCFGLLAAGWLAGQSAPELSAQGKAGMPPAVTPGKSAPASEKAEAPPVLRPNDDRNVVAYVNDVPITRQELGEELIARRGKEYVKLLINRKIIEQACAKEGISVTDQEVNEDLLEMARRLGCGSLAEFERTALKERKLTLHEYKEDVARPALMVRKLAGKAAEPTPEELEKAFEANYGKKIQCLMILEPKKSDAERAWEQVRGRTKEQFVRVAKLQSDTRLAQGGGLVAPINKHSALGRIEEAAFGMKNGEVSEIIQVPEGYVILYRIEEVPAQKDVKFKDVEDMLRKDIHDKKVALEAPRLFKELEKKAEVRDYLNLQSNFVDAATRMEKQKNPSGPVPLPKDD